MSPIDVTLEQALELLAQPKAMRRGFGAHERAAQGLRRRRPSRAAIQLLEGRYGLYLTDGVTNASLPKGLTPEALTIEQALELLAARAALGPPKKKAGPPQGDQPRPPPRKRAEPRRTASAEKPAEEERAKRNRRPRKKSPSKKG